MAPSRRCGYFSRIQAASIPPEQSSTPSWWVNTCSVLQQNQTNSPAEPCTFYKCSICCRDFLRYQSKWWGIPCNSPLSVCCSSKVAHRHVLGTRQSPPKLVRAHICIPWHHRAPSLWFVVVHFRNGARGRQHDCWDWWVSDIYTYKYHHYGCQSAWDFTSQPETLAVRMLLHCTQVGWWFTHRSCLRIQWLDYVLLLVHFCATLQQAQHNLHK